MIRWLESSQALGRALMLPIAVLPAAGLLLRLGQPDMLDIAPIAAAGDAIFSNLGLLFAIGIAVGLARENHGAAGLAGVVAYLVASKGAEVLITLPPDIAAKAVSDAAAGAAYKARQVAKVSVPIGILSGILAGQLYNRFHDIRLPPYLAFFAGRRFVPIVAGAAGLVLAFLFGLGFPYVERAMDSASRAVIGSGEVGLFIYGVLNRALIVTGLHHILNNIAWFLVGDYHGVTGDLKRFFAGDPSAGAFMAGFFPVMMFGLPAACLAMYRTARPERRRAAGGLLLSLALTSFLTGVTEPIEFAFMFLAPALYALHAVLTGTAMVIMDLLGVRLGFGFSAGLFDYVLNFTRSTRPLLLVPVGLVYFGLYYALFRYCIVRFDLRTPGREPEAAVAAATKAAASPGRPADAYVAALGGAANLESVDACTTRLRLVLRDRKRVDADALRGLGASGSVNVGASGLQVVVGPIADQLAGEIRASVSGGSARVDAAAWMQALGGAGNVVRLESVPGRLLVTVRDAGCLDAQALVRLGARGVGVPSPTSVHVLHADAPALESSLAPAL
ncbi:MAG TPA: N-acetylglucosamine-specific PTS transporter subunit IIBC [Usitatibacter sp.]|jgi:PTS system N-acetylglucosamine-specific IIC component|nr:N-acetylglucosamine-specific PTS transporter subunit IIBC [Usitatibacter sp.]